MMERSGAIRFLRIAMRHLKEMLAPRAVSVAECPVSASPPGYFSGHGVADDDRRQEVGAAGPGADETADFAARTASMI